MYDRAPAWQITAIVRSRGSSCKRCGTDLIGISCAPLMRQISSSHGSRTSSTAGGSGSASIDSSCAGVISRTSTILCLREKRHGHVAVLRAPKLRQAPELRGERLRFPAVLDHHDRVVAQL